MKILNLDATACRAARPQLADLLLDALATGPALGFSRRIDAAAAGAYWDAVAAALAERSRVLLALAHEGTVIGSVQLALCEREDGVACAQVRDLMVHRRVRRRGLGGVLLRAAEAEAALLRRRQLFLGIEAGSEAEALFHGYGYARDAAGAPDRIVYRKALLAMEAA